jgi:hypothetical protein
MNGIQVAVNSRHLEQKRVCQSRLTVLEILGPLASGLTQRNHLNGKYNKAACDCTDDGRPEFCRAEYFQSDPPERARRRS